MGVLAALPAQGAVLCASEDEQQQLGEQAVDADPQATEGHPALLACYSPATQGLDLFAQRAGQPSLRLVDPSLARPDEPHAVRRGINLHAKLSVGGNDSAQLERLCRYLGRPPIARERLQSFSDGRLRYEFKKAWKNGTRAVVLELPLNSMGMAY